MSRVTKELIEQQKKYIWFLYEEINRIRYRDRIHLKLKETIRRDIIDAEDELEELQCRYQDEQRRAEIERRQQAKSNRTTKELIEREKKELRCLYDESDRIECLIKIYGRTIRLKNEQEEVRWYIANSHDELDKLEWQYQEEQRQAKEKKCQEVEAARRLEEQEKKNEDVHNSEIVDVSIETDEIPKDESDIVWKQPIVESSETIFEMFTLEESIIQEVEPVQTEKLSEVTLELSITEEETVREVDLIQADRVEFIIPDNLLQRPLTAKAMLSSAIFPKFFESYREKILSTVFQHVLSMKRSSWFILLFYKTRGRVFSNKGRNDGDHCYIYVFMELMYLFRIDVMLGVT